MSRFSSSSRTAQYRVIFFTYACRAWVSTGATGAWHPRNYWTVLSSTRWFWQFYYIMLCFTLKIWGFTSDWQPLFQIPKSSPGKRIVKDPLKKTPSGLYSFLGGFPGEIPYPLGSEVLLGDLSLWQHWGFIMYIYIWSKVTVRWMKSVAYLGLKIKRS